MPAAQKQDALERLAANIADGDLLSLKKYFEADFDVNARDGDGYTLLHILAFEDQSSYLPRLLAKPGLDINALDESGSTPLHVAVEFAGLTFVKGICEFPGVDFKRKNPEGMHALQLAEMFERPDITAYLKSLQKF